MFFSKKDIICFQPNRRRKQHHTSPYKNRRSPKVIFSMFLIMDMYPVKKIIK